MPLKPRGNVGPLLPEPESRVDAVGHRWQRCHRSLWILFTAICLLPASAWAATASLSVTGPQAGTTYYAGDTFTLTVTGAANAAVTVSQNGSAQGSVGTTNSSGVLSISGSWSSSDVGSYTQTWYVAGVAAPTLSFSIRALPAATATIAVTGPRSGNTYYVGDSYTITVTGAPNAPVTVNQNGSQSGQLGTTNSSGSWSTSGTWTTASIGTYVQTWQVAGMSAPTITSYVAAIPYYSISGTITSGGVGVQGVTVTLSNCQSASKTTDSSGAYSFSVSAFCNYNVTPSKPYYTFTPTYAYFSSLSGSQTANFTATATQYTISGATGVAGVTMTLSGSQSATTTTSSTGTYSFSANGGGNYTVTPSKAGYWFTPSSASFTNLSGSQTANFTAAPVTVSLTVTGPQSGTTYQAGDSYVLAVKGPPNQPVTVSQTRTSFAPAIAWQTDASGNLSIPGTWTASDVSNYTQTWYVGGNQALPVLSITIVLPPTPTVTSISPASAAAGSAVTITGTHFGTSRWNSTVTFNGIAATAFSNWTDTSITVTVPSGATTGPVIVNSNGVAPSAGYQFTVSSSQPSIASLSPSSIAARGPAFTLAVFGTNYLAGATVSWGATALSTTFVSATQLTATVPASLIANAGDASITVTTSAGTSAPVFFSVVSMTPSITGLSPSSGARGSSVTVTGSYFGVSQGSSTIAFNGVQATVSSWSDNQIQALVPPTATTGNVVVTVAGAASNGATFSVAGPYIANVVSFSGSAASYGTASGTMSTKVSITGTSFGSDQGTSSITFNGLLAPSVHDHTFCNNECMWSDTKIQVQVPEGARTGDVVVTVGGQQSNGVHFDIVAPVITSVTTPTGTTPLTAQFYDRIRIIGKNFGADQFISGDKINDDSVTFNVMAGPSVHDQTLCSNNCSWSDQEIDIQVPPGATSGNLIVHVNGMATNAIPLIITSPAITKLSTDIGTPGTQVDITGVNFGAVQGNSVVYIENTAVAASVLAPIISWSDTKISFTVPATAVTGFVAVVPSSGPSSNWVPFTVPGTNPILTQLSPPAGPVGSQVVLSGSNLGMSGTVTFNGTQAAANSWTATSITVVVPSGATTGNVVVSANGMVTNGLPFTVTDAPVITGVSPASGRAGTVVAISGARFGPASASNVAKFNDKVATVTSWSDTLIGAIVPANIQPGNATVSIISGGVPSVVTPAASFSVMCCGTVPYITSITTSRGLNWALPGETGLLQITGGNLFAAVNTIGIYNSNPGVSMTAQSVSADGTSLTASYTVLPGAPAGTSLVTVSLLSGTSNSLAFYVNQPLPPIISGNGKLWYLGGAQVNDNCSPGDVNNQCYYSYTQLTITLPLGAVGPTPSAPAQWVITPANDFTSLQCANPSCSTAIVAVTAQPPSCASIGTQVYVGGVASPIFPITVDWPATAGMIKFLDMSVMLDNGNLIGYLSDNTLQVVSSCGVRMAGVATHEEFPLTTFQSCRANAGWTLPVDSIGSWITSANANPAFDGVLTDSVGVADGSGARTPDPQCPGDTSRTYCQTNATVPQGPVGTDAITYSPQFIFIGSTNTTPSGMYFTARPNMQVRYVDHGRDEVGWWTCP